MPHHPDQNDDVEVRGPRSRRTLVVVVAIAALLLAVIALHVAGIH